MSIKLNNQLITSLKINNQNVTEVMLDSVRVYPLEPQIYVEFDFPWDSQTNSYAEYGYPAPVSQGDNYNRVNLIGGPELEESKLNDLLFNVYGTGAKEKISGNFTNFNVWYEVIFPVESSVFAKAEVRFGPDYMDLRKSQFSENNMASWYDTVWDFNGVKLPAVQTKQWVYITYETSLPTYQYYAYVSYNTTQEDWIDALEYEFPAKDLAVGTMGYVMIQGEPIYPLLQVQEV